jgi:hypothetical protein
MAPRGVVFLCGRRDTPIAARLGAADVEGALAMHATATLA